MQGLLGCWLGSGEGRNKFRDKSSRLCQGLSQMLKKEACYGSRCVPLGLAYLARDHPCAHGFRYAQGLEKQLREEHTAGNVKEVVPYGKGIV
jgi:hypothetical protein